MAFLTDEKLLIVGAVLEDRVDVALNKPDKHHGKNDGCSEEGEVKEVFDGSDDIFHSIKFVV